MSLPGFEAFTTALSAGANLRAGKEREGLIAEQKKAAERENNRAEVEARNNQLVLLATRANVVRPGALEIDADLMQEALKPNPDGQIKPEVQALLSALGNIDGDTPKGFQFKNAIVNDGQITLTGSHENGTPGVATVNRASDDAAPVASMSAGDAANLASSQYFMYMSDPAYASRFREQQLKQQGVTVGGAITDRALEIQQSLGAQQGAIQNALTAIGNKKLSADFKRSYAAASGNPQEQYKILQLFSEKLELQNGLPPEEEVAKLPSEKPPLNPDGSEQRPALSNVPLDDLQARISKVDQTGPGIPLSPKAVQAVANSTDKDIAEGKVQFTQEDITSLRQGLVDAGIGDMIALQKQDRTTQRQVWAALSSLATTDSQKDAYNTLFVNMLSTGTSMDQKSLSAARVAQQNADTSQGTLELGQNNYRVALQNSNRQMQELGNDISKERGEFFGKVDEQFNKGAFGVDGDEINETMDWDEKRFQKAVFGVGGAATKTASALRASKNRLGLETGVVALQGTDAYALRQKLNSIYSNSIQAMNLSNKYEWSFATDSDPGIVGGDNFFNRISFTPAKDGTPASFIILDQASGNKTGDEIPASDVKKMFGAKLYIDFVAQLRQAKAGKPR